MAIYSPERKEAILKQMLPPLSRSIGELSEQEQIPYQTLYNWRFKAMNTGAKSVPKNQLIHWSPEAKLAVIIETAAMSVGDLGAYCRGKGLHAETIKLWKKDSLNGFSQGPEQRKQVAKEQIASKRQVKAVQKELRRKDRDLAEASALLILEKKLTALWGDDSEAE